VARAAVVDHTSEGVQTELRDVRPVGVHLIAAGPLVAATLLEQQAEGEVLSGASLAAEVVR